MRFVAHSTLSYCSKVIAHITGSTSSIIQERRPQYRFYDNGHCVSNVIFEKNGPIAPPA